MTTEEMEILQFLKQTPDTYYARKEICRKARSRDDYEANPHWAAAPLNNLVALGHVVQNPSGHYKLSEDYDG